MRLKATTAQKTLLIALIIGMLMLSTFMFPSAASDADENGNVGSDSDSPLSMSSSISSSSIPYSILVLDVPGIAEDRGALDAAGIPYTAVTPVEFATVTLSDYDALFVSWLPSGADPSAFNALMNRKTEIATLISNGWGVVANSEWSGSSGVPGTPYGWLPVTITTGGLNTGSNVHITKPTHPIITGGGPLGGGQLTDALLSEWYASYHNLITNYEECQDIAVKAGTTDAVILAITYGSGRIVVTGMDPTWHTLYGVLVDKTGPKTLIKNSLDWASGYPPAIISAIIDIDPDTLNLKGNGKWITAYIELPAGYDVANIDLSTVLIESSIPAETDPQYDFVTDPNVYLVDHDADGIMERLVKFDRAEVQSTVTNEPDYDSAPKFYELTLTVTGELADGTLFEGSDTITVIKK